MTRQRSFRILPLAVLAAALGVFVASAGAAPARCEGGACGRDSGGPAPPAVARGHDVLSAPPASPAAPPGLARKAALAAKAPQAKVPQAKVPAASAAPQPGPWCGGADWRLLTLSDGDRDAVDLRPEETTISRIAALASPGRASHRSTAFQRQAWRVQAVVDRYRIGSDGEIALVLYDIPSGRYLDAYLANPDCLPAQTRERHELVAAREALTRHCPRVTPSWQLLGATARVTGVGYWNPVRTTRGALPNGAELRPVTGFQIVSGCGYP